MKIRIALVDDHILLRNALAVLIRGFDNCTVVLESNNGDDFIKSLKHCEGIDIVILDLNMPVMDGYATSIWLKEHKPEIHVLMLTMYDSELTLIRLLQAGVKGFLKKDIDPTELKFALNAVLQSGYYYSTQTAGRLANLFRVNARDNYRLQNSMLTDHEVDFLKYACSDLTYKEIAQKMSLTPRSVDVLRDQLFVKLNVKSRVGLAMLAIRQGVVTQAY
jgi:DNA-binding NarL/FixJ family response regulator